VLELCESVPRALEGIIVKASDEFTTTV